MAAKKKAQRARTGKAGGRRAASASLRARTARTTASAGRSRAAGTRTTASGKRAAARAAPSRKRTTARAAAAAHDLRAERARLERNKQLVLTLYAKLIGEKDFEAARPYLGDTYRQHAPYAADGHEGVAAWVRGFKQAFPDHRYEVKKVVAEGDLVVLHLHGMNGPNPFGESVIDIFRIEDGKVVEHWDVIQPIPESADNANTMF
ncbi:MAG TPA: ester cyclase [Steroidobacteraceae bacterium]|nr:ester cyclase [Steroidobacteraceae bacterium]